MWNRTTEVDRRVNATNRSGTGSSGRGPSQYITQNESQSMPILITKSRNQKKQHEKIRSQNSKMMINMIKNEFILESPCDTHYKFYDKD